MRKSYLAALLMFSAGLLSTLPATATAFGLFQHGGIGVGEAGALVARAVDPGALSYNPAGIAALPGLQLQIGADMNQGVDDYLSSSAEKFTANHVINYPPSVYVTWRAKQTPFAFGIGVDSPFWYTQNWEQARFPGRFLSRRFELTLFEVHPVVAYDLGEGYSVALGYRYETGNLKQGDNRLVGFTPPGGGAPLPVELARDSNAKVDGNAWDLGFRYASQVWGWGAVYRSQATLKGSSSAHYTPLNAAPATLSAAAQQFPTGSASTSFLLPWEARGGAWIAPYPELRLELDYVFQHWSSLQATTIHYDPNPIEGLPTVAQARNWKDSSSLRLGIEGNVTDGLVLFGGIAYETTPVPRSTLDPTFPRGDARILATGFSYNFPNISFDAGISLHSFKNRNADNQELLGPPGATGTYKGTDRVWGGGVRWRF
ncbi:MAG: outer membrane protein transport protein [Acidobacteriota bacterium]|nr:outer membrane protein transport protein [Acidobacteriota bacterium]